LNAVSSDIREVVKKSHRDIFKRLLISTKRGLVMGSPAKQTIIAQMPEELAVAAEDLAIEMGSSIRRHQQVLTGLADVDEGRVVSCADMLDFIVRLKTE
jgi:hypothetical protein